MQHLLLFFIYQCIICMVYVCVCVRTLTFYTHLHLAHGILQLL